MEVIGVIFGLAIGGSIIIGGILGIVAFVMMKGFRDRFNMIERDLVDLVSRVYFLEKAGRQKERPAAAEPSSTQTSVEPVPVTKEKPPAAPVEPVRPAVFAPCVPAAAPPVGFPPAEPPPPPAPEAWSQFEASIGKRWMTWAGAVALFASAGFFVKYAFDNQWLGPTGRVVLGILFGLAMLVGGDRAIRRRMRALGQGLMGGGLAVLYVSLFAGFSLYKLMPQAAAFASMVAVSGLGIALALVHDALTTSFLAILGGLLTPVMVSTGHDARDALFAYLTLLDLCVLAVAFFKDWRSLDLLAFAGTFALYGGWFSEFYGEAALVPALLWLAGFYFIFLILPFAYHLRRGMAAKVERFIMALANAAVVFGFAYRMLKADYTHALGFTAVGLSACYLAMAWLTRRRIPSDRKALLGFTAYAVIFLTLAVPLHLRTAGITLAWAVEGPILLYLGYRYRYMPVRIGAFMVLALAVGRLFAVHWPLHSEAFVLLFNRHFLSAALVPACAAAFALVHHARKAEASEADRVFKIVCGLGSGLLTLAILHSELVLWDEYTAYPDLYGRSDAVMFVLTLLWALGTFAYFGAGVKLRSAATRAFGFVPMAVLFAVASSAYLASGRESFALFMNLRFLAGMTLVLTTCGCGLILRRSRETCSEAEQTLAKLLYAASALLFLILLSLEAYQFSLNLDEDPQRARWIAGMALSIVWGVYASVDLVIGFWKNLRELRFSALALFGLTALKLVFVDLAGLDQIYRIVSFVVLGLLMIGASYLYHVVEKRFMASSGEKK